LKKKIFNRGESGRKQFTRFASKHMTLAIDNENWPCKRIHIELRIDSKIESYINTNDGNIPSIEFSISFGDDMRDTQLLSSGIVN